MSHAYDFAHVTLHVKVFGRVRRKSALYNIIYIHDGSKSSAFRTNYRSSRGWSGSGGGDSRSLGSRHAITDRPTYSVRSIQIIRRNYINKEMI